jgi:hypothetical protein
MRYTVVQKQARLGAIPPDCKPRGKINMETKSFFEAYGATIPAAEIASKGGLSYLSAATAMRLAGRPEVTFVDFDGKPHLEMLNGSVVAVDLLVPGTDATQRMYLPVMDRDNTTIDIGKTTLTDINNSRQRCLVKAIAAVYGVGMSVFMGCDGDGAKAVKLLGISPETDLETAEPIVSTLKAGGAPYVEWNAGLAACRITDPTFRWDVVLWDGLPYRKVLGGLMVDVDTIYDGLRQRISLPIMDSAFNQVPADKATVFDWNKTVMRALTKCIAFKTGYGLGVYADEFGKEEADGKETDAKKTARKSSTSSKADAKADAVSTTKVEAKADAKADAAAETKVEAKADVKAEAAPAAADVATATDAAAQADTAAADTVAAPAAEVAAPVAEVAAPAAEAAAPVVAQEASAPAAAAEAPAAAAADNEAVGRFREVMRKRKEAAGVKGIVSLYEALTTSTKFADEEKPACFAVLVTASASMIDSENIQDLLGNLLVYKAMQHVPQDTRDIIGAKLTSVALNTAVAQGDEALRNAHLDLMSSGVAVDDTDVFRLAKLANVPQETIDLLRDVLDLATA